jgi:tetratricopeptide (TPR) repeat protein
MAYANCFSGSFVFDDAGRIMGNPEIRRLDRCMIGSSRPLVNLTLHLNYALGGFKPAEYRLFNVVIHIFAGLFLAGLVTRTLRLPMFLGKWDHNAAIMGSVVGALWVAHPLQTESVTYVIQRAESMAGMFTLSSLYCFVRSLDSSATTRLKTISVASCVLAMLSKAVAVVTPALILMFDAFFAAGSIAAAIRQRKGYYCAVAATWLVPALIFAFPNESSASAGPGLNIAPPLVYLLIQTQVILHYVRLAFWPADLCIDYVWLPPESLVDLAPYAIAVAFGTLSIAWFALRKRPLAFAGTWFLLTLAPSSSVFPIADFAVEHRMYLPLAGIVVFTVFSIHYLLKRVISNDKSFAACAGCMAVGCMIALGARTAARNSDYLSTVSMMRSVVDKRPDNFRARLSYTMELLNVERYAEAVAAGNAMLTRINEKIDSGKPLYQRGPASAVYFLGPAHDHLGRALIGFGRPLEAQKHFEEAIRLDPSRREYRYNIALALILLGKDREALDQLDSALRLDRNYSMAHELSGKILARQGEYAAAERHYEQVLESPQPTLSAKESLAWLLATCPDDGVRDGRKGLELALAVNEETRHVSFHAVDVLAAAYAESGRFDNAVETGRLALELAGNSKSASSDFEAIKGRLLLYEEKKPFRIAPAK